MRGVENVGLKLITFSSVLVFLVLLFRAWESSFALLESSLALVAGALVPLWIIQLRKERHE